LGVTGVLTKQIRDNIKNRGTRQDMTCWRDYRMQWCGHVLQTTIGLFQIIRSEHGHNIDVLMGGLRENGKGFVIGRQTLLETSMDVDGIT
jgi:hypothetical protein